MTAWQVIERYSRELSVWAALSSMIRQAFHWGCGLGTRRNPKDQIWVVGREGLQKGLTFS